MLNDFFDLLTKAIQQQLLEEADLQNASEKTIASVRKLGKWAIVSMLLGEHVKNQSALRNYYTPGSTSFQHTLSACERIAKSCEDAEQAFFTLFYTLTAQTGLDKLTAQMNWEQVFDTVQEALQKRRMERPPAQRETDSPCMRLLRQFYWYTVQTYQAYHTKQEKQIAEFTKGLPKSMQPAPSAKNEEASMLPIALFQQYLSTETTLVEIVAATGTHFLSEPPMHQRLINYLYNGGLLTICINDYNSICQLNPHMRQPTQTYMTFAEYVKGWERVQRQFPKQVKLRFIPMPLLHSLIAIHSSVPAQDVIYVSFYAYGCDNIPSNQKAVFHAEDPFFSHYQKEITYLYENSLDSHSLMMTETNSKPRKPLHISDFLDVHLKPDVTQMDLIFECGGRFFTDEHCNDLLRSYLERGGILNVMVNSPEAAEPIARHMRSATRHYIPFAESIADWKKLQQQYPMQMQLYVTDLPILQCIAAVHSKTPENSAVYVSFYAYAHDDITLHQKSVFSGTHPRVAYYIKTIEYMQQFTRQQKPALLLPNSDCSLSHPLQVSDFLDGYLKPDITEMDLVFKAGGRCFTDEHTHHMLCNYLERGGRLNVIVNSPEAAESITQPIRSVTRHYISFPEAIADWQKLQQQYPKQVQLYVTDLPLLQCIAAVHSENPENSAIYVSFYAYGHDDVSFHQKSVFLGTHPRFSYYMQELEYIRQYTGQYKQKRLQSAGTVTLRKQMHSLEFLERYLSSETECLEIAFQKGSRFLAEERFHQKMMSYLEAGGILRVLINSYDTTEAFAVHMQEESRSHYPTDLLIRDWKQLRERFPKQVTLFFSDLPLMHGMIVVQNKAPEKSAMYISFYAYTQVGVSHHQKSVFLETEPYFTHYLKELRYLQTHTDNTIHFSVGKQPLPFPYASPYGLRLLDFLKQYLSSDTVCLEMAIHRGSSLMYDVYARQLLTQYLKAGGKIKILMDSEESTSMLMPHMTGRNDISFEKGIAVWGALQEQYPKQVTLQINSIPLLHRIVIVRAADPAKSIMAVRFYAYGQTGFSPDQKCIFQGNDAYFAHYETELRYMQSKAKDWNPKR